MAYPFVRALVVLPRASNGSIRSRITSGAPDISAIPPALSTIGPNPSMVSTIPAVESIPMAAIVVP